MNSTQTTVTGERADLLASLAKQRHFLRYTARDLTDEHARQRTTASELSVGGLIKHVTAVEERWAGFIVGGPAAMRREGEDAGPDAWARGFQLLENETLAGVLAEYERVASETEELVLGLPDLDLPAAAAGTVVRAGGALVGPAGAAAHHRGDRAACRSRRHHPGVAGRRQVHGLTASSPAAGAGRGGPGHTG